MIRHSDRGTSSVEVAILAPALLAMILLAIGAMRVELAGQSVDAAAHDAARAASISRDGADATANATSAARAALDQDNLVCSDLTVNVNVDGFGRGLGEPGSVSATVTCVVDLSDISIPGTPGTKTLTATYTSVLDQYNEQS
jgi:Flp pilus assembly protein TadG